MNGADKQPSWTNDLLLYAHIGDLHITESAKPNYRHFLSIVAEIEEIARTKLDFVFLPGDNADNGRDKQYELVATGLRMLSMPFFAITGDHDMETGSIEPFRRALEPRKLPHTQLIRGIDCVFLDMSGRGTGGPDFRLPPDQTRHLKGIIDRAKCEAQCVAVFMHTYPADLVDSSERAAINDLLADPVVRLVDMGHTHYNELANDGRTIFAATRSTGQIEEGAVGYSITAIEERRRKLAFQAARRNQSFCFDHIARRPAASYKSRHARRARRSCGRPKSKPHQAMRMASGRRTMATHAANARRARLRGRTNSAREADRSSCHRHRGTKTGIDIIELADAKSGLSVPNADGSDNDAIEAWPEHHLLGTQLGPNRNGRKW